MSYLNEFSKSHCIGEKMTPPAWSSGPAPSPQDGDREGRSRSPGPRTGKEEQLRPARQSPALRGILSISHSLCCFGTCYRRHMLPRSVRCQHITAQLGSGAEERSKRTSTAEPGSVMQGFGEVGERCQLKSCKNTEDGPLGKDV